MSPAKWVIAVVATAILTMLFSLLVQPLRGHSDGEQEEHEQLLGGDHRSVNGGRLIPREKLCEAS